MTNELPRMLLMFALVLFVVGLLIWGRGEDHHRGDDIGAAAPVGFSVSP